MRADEGHLPQEEITIAEALKTKGYATGHFGKWHVGGFDEETAGSHVMPPWQAGFDECFSTRNVIITHDPYAKLGRGGIKACYWRNGRNIPLREARRDPTLRGDDAAITGWWNQELGDWEVLDNEHRNEIRKGLRMARQLIAPELLLLPVPAAGEASASRRSLMSWVGGGSLGALVCGFAVWALMRPDPQPAHPVGRGMGGDRAVEHPAPGVVEDEEDVQHPKSDGRHREEVHRSDDVAVIAHEGEPALDRAVTP